MSPLRLLTARPAARRALRPWPLVMAAGGLAGCPAEYESPPNPPPYAPPPAVAPAVVYPEVHAELMLTNLAATPQLFRIRLPRPDVQIDCAAMAEDPAGRLVEGLFGPAQAWMLDPGRAMSVRPQYAGGACAAAWVDGPGLEPRLVFFAPVEYPAYYHSTQASAVRPDRALVVSGGTEARTWGSHPALHVPRRPDEVGVECTTPDPGAGVDWSTPPTGLVALLGHSVGADGCHALDLQLGEAPYRWFVCAPGADLPFAVGEDLTVSPLYGGAAGGAAEGVRIESPSGRLTLLRGGDLPVSFVLEDVEGCPGHVDTCGGFVQAARVQVAGIWMDPGSELALAEGTLHLYRAERAMAVNQACLPFARIGAPTLEAAWVERFEAPEDAPPADEPPADEPPVDEPPAEDPPADEPPAEDPPAEDPPADEPPAEDPPAEDPPAEDPPAEGEDPAAEPDPDEAP